MSMVSAFFRRNTNGEFPTLPGASGSLGIASPWETQHNLTRVILSQLIGLETEYAQPDRLLARTVPAVAAGENLLHQTVGSLPLRTFDREGKPNGKVPTWATETSDVFQSPYIRTCSTLSDLYYVGYSLWEVTSRGADGYPLDMLHRPIGGEDGWKTETYGKVRRVVIGGNVKQPHEYVLFQSPFPGLLNSAWRTISHALDLEDTIAARSATPAPIQKLIETQETNLTDEEISEYIAQYIAARRSRSGGVVHVPFGTDLANMEQPDGANAFLLEARNAVVSDIAKHTGLPSGLLEGTSSIDSLSYTTERGQRSRFLDFSLRLWLDPIQTRLSRGDVTPQGTSVAFDLAELIDAPSRAGLDAPETNTPNALPAPRTEAA